MLIKIAVFLTILDQRVCQLSVLTTDYSFFRSGSPAECSGRPDRKAGHLPGFEMAPGEVARVTNVPEAVGRLGR